MGVRRKLYSLILSIGMVLGMLTGIPVYAAGETLVVAWPSGWDDGINEPKKSDEINDYSDGIEIDVKSEATIYLGTSMDDPIKVAQLDAVSVTKENGDPVNDIIIEPFSSGWDDEKNEAIIPDKGFFNIKTGSSGLYFINYGDAKINLRVVMPRYGIYTSDKFTEENVVPLEDGRIYFDSDKETTYYAHLGFFDYNGVDHQEGEGAPYSAKLDIDCDNDKFALNKINETTFKITILSSTYESAHIKMFGEIYMNEGGECDGYDQRDYDLMNAKTGILASWDDYGNFKENINDYNKYFNDIAVRTERMLSFGWGKNENGFRYVTPYEGTLECISDNKDKIHISKSLDDNGQPRKGLYDISADTSGLYTIKATNGEEISTLVIDIGIPKIGIYSSETASEATFLAAEWTTLNVKKGETYYVIPTPKEDNRKVTSFEVEFDESAPFTVKFDGATITDGNKYTWEYSADYPKPICSFKVYDEFEDELGDAIRCKAIFTDKEDPNDWYNHDGNISVASVKEGFVVSGRWYEESFEENNSNFRRSCDMITFWDGGVHLGIASYKDGIYTVTPINDISKLRITDTQGKEVSKDDAFISKTYERDGNEITINNDGVYAVRFDKPGEYHIEYTDGESPQYVTVNVDDPVGGFYNQCPEYNDPLKGYINGRKDQKFFYDDDNRTFYFAFRRVLEKDDRGDNNPENDVDRRIYVYSNGTIEERIGNNDEKYDAAVESDEFVLCKSYYDSDKDEDIQEPITDPDYAKIEAEENVGAYTVFKITLGDKYDGYGLMTRLAKKQREWKQMENGQWDYTDNYVDDHWDDFWVNCEEKKTGFVIAWPDDGDVFPTNLDYFNKNHTVEIGEDMHLAAGFITEDGQGYKVNPVISDISLQDDKGNPVNSDIAQIDLKSGGIFELSVKKCGTYRLAYNDGGKIYYATIEVVLPMLAFYSSAEPSEETLVNDGTTEVFAKKGDKFYLCHNLNSWDLNEIDSIDVSVPGQDKLIIPQEDLKKGRCIYTLEFEDSIHYEMFFNWKDPNRHDQRMFNFQLSFEGLGVSFPGDEGVFDTNPNDYLQLNHVTMRCHEWKCFAIISEDEGIKTVTPIAGTKENLDKFNITYGDGSALSKSDISYIQLIEENGSYKEGVFEVYLYKPGQYRIYYGDEYVTVNSATPDVSFTSEEGTYSETEYSIIEEDPFSIGMGQVDEIDYYISTLDGSNTEEDGYYVNKITGIYVKKPKEPDENFNKYFTYKISDDGTSAKIHVDREVNLSEIIFGVTYDSSFYAKQDDNSYAFDKNRSWQGDDEFHIYIENDERELVDLSEVKWNYTKAFEYDSEEKKVELTGLAEVVEVKYTDNAKTDIGKYTAKAELSIKEDKKETYKLPRPIDEKLQILEWEIVMPETIQAVIDSINDLPAKDKIKSTDKEKIDAAKAAYDKLTDDEKALIDANTVKKLTEAKKALEAIEKAAADKEAEEKAAKEEAEKKEAADKEAAEKVIKLINELPETSKITTNDEVKITVARTAYNALTTSQKNCVTADILKKLTDAETTLAKLKEKQPDPDKKAPKVGSVLTNKELKASYKVTKISGKNKLGEVGIYKVTSKTAKSFNIPKTIEVDGFKYSVTSIEINAFMGMSKLQKVSIPDTIIKIKNNAFKDCKALKSVTIPKKVTSIGTGVFMGCKKLRTVTFQGTRIKTIPSSAFSGCSVLNSIIIPQNVTSIGTKAFLGCVKLTKINVKSTKLKKVGGNAFKGINAKAKITVPKEKKTAYTKLFKKKGQPNTVEIK